MIRILKKICEEKGLVYLNSEREQGLIYINFLCPKHEFAGIQKIRKSNLARKNFSGCLYCYDKKRYKMSKGETAIAQTLDELSIPYLPQYTFEDCKNERNLRYDFYLPFQKICIEFDGAHHFKPVCYLGISEEKALENFINTQKLDEIKNSYCNSHDISLIRIPYYKSKEIPLILSQNLIQ